MNCNVIVLVMKQRWCMTGSVLVIWCRVQMMIRQLQRTEFQGLLKESHFCNESYYKNNLTTQNQSAIQHLHQFILDENKIDTVSRGYFMKDSVLMRKWRLLTVPASQEWSVIYQTMIPRKHHNTVLNLALAGYLGINKKCH